MNRHNPSEYNLVGDRVRLTLRGYQDPDDKFGRVIGHGRPPHTEEDLYQVVIDGPEEDVMVLTARDFLPIPSLYYTHADDWFVKGRSAGGSFVDRLFDLLGVADGQNLDRLREAFPAIVGAWTHRQRCAVLTLIPHSEVAMHMRIAGQWRWVAPRPNGMAQVLNPDGSPFSAPITRGEAGVEYDAEDEPEEAGRGVE